MFEKKLNRLGYSEINASLNSSQTVINWLIHAIQRFSFKEQHEKPLSGFTTTVQCKLSWEPHGPCRVYWRFSPLFRVNFNSRSIQMIPAGDGTVQRKSQWSGLRRILCHARINKVSATYHSNLLLELRVLESRSRILRLYWPLFRQQNCHFRSWVGLIEACPGYVYKRTRQFETKTSKM